jgi:predicted methyltransferase MtxX (methanogen marker protein 4)
MTQDNQPRGSLAATPDLGWSQVRETVLMLELAAGQVDAAMRDSNSSVEVLTDTFTSLAETLGQIEAAVATLPDTVGNGMVKSEIQQNTRVVSQKVHQAIIAFQFYDKLVQRLDHVCHCLGGLSRLVADKGRLYNPDQWVALQDTIKSKYTMIEEREMFEAVLGGMAVAAAIEQFMVKREEATAGGGGDIELF